MSLEDLRGEYVSTERIGPKILNEVRRVVHGLIRRYNPEIYGGAANWEDAEEDVVQGVVTELLLAEGQLDYLMTTCTHMEDFDRLLARQVRRYLARGRRRNVIDNLLDRAKEILASDPFETNRRGDRPVYRLVGRPAAERDPTEEELNRVARTAALVPRVPFAGAERAPIVYSKEHLARLLLAVAEGLPCTFSRPDLQRILELALTDWVAGLLTELEEVRAVPASALTPEEVTMVGEAERQIFEACTDQERLILQRKLENISDQEVAAQLRLSRQTIVARKKAIFEKMQMALEGLSEPVQASTIERLSMDLMVRGPLGATGEGDERTS